ncbi:PAS domain-containing sensor histidine kinase [Halarcobacter anaerophilus]|uniref:PAS domain-containing sensor histidine kinase n=1 Tax=Halarcobacter anaerophilus TaxID=877500 RepID=UPI0006982FE8|nr:PAS domain-containing sensor histidine kinase [Halarcobacter anaerophilus]
MDESKQNLEDNIIKQNKEIDTLNEYYSKLFEHTQVGIICLNPDGSFIKANQTFCNILGYTKEELQKLNFLEITYKDDIDKSVDLYNNVSENKKRSYNLEKRYIRKDGKLIWTEIFVNHITDKKGKFLYTLGVVTDISKRKGIQDTILEQTKTMQLYLDIVDVAIVVVNKQGNITLVNRKTCEILGFEEYSILGKNWFKNFISKDERMDQIKDFQDAIINKTDISEKIQYSVICSSSEKRTILWRRRYIYDEEKSIDGMISSGEDITELLKLEEEKRKNDELLFQQAKLASIAEMLRNIAHQWRQPLSTISTAASGMKMQKEMGILSDEDFDLGMSSIVGMTKYLSQTINDFQSFFKVDDINKEFTNEELFFKVENFILTTFKASNIELNIRAKEHFTITGSLNEMIKIIITLLNNARDAFAQKNLDKKAVFLESHLQKKSFSIIVKDNAGGIKEEIKNKIFEPYFTTKHQSLGTGIGLFMVKNVVENRLNGKIEVHNEEVSYKKVHRIGAVFKITVPIKKY